MVPQRLVTTLQFCGAALGIPAAAAGSYAAYQNYFSSDAACQRLRGNILAVMERRISAETKRTLLRKDVTEFDKSCGEADPDARTVFQAALQDPEPRPARPSAAAAPQPRTGVAGSAAPSTEATSQPRRTPVPVFGGDGHDDHGWVALSRREARSWTPNFTGYEISSESLPPPGTVLTAQHRMPVWSEVQGTTNDHTKLRGVLPAGACIRVLAARPGSGRLWAEVAPAACSM
jgi:hypothetical protein